MKTFKYKNYENCSFVINSYAKNKEAMAISIVSNNESIDMCTVYLNYMPYDKDIVTIKNYSENSHMTEFFKKLGIVIEIIERIPCNPHVANTYYTKNPQTIDLCLIDIDILKKYCSKCTYEF